VPASATPAITAQPAPREVADNDMDGPTRNVAPPGPSTTVESQPRPILAALASRRYYLKLTIGQETHDTLERLRGLLRHSVPDGDLATIVDRALTVLLRETERVKCASTSKPRETSATNTTRRHVPAAVRRAVWSRDGGRCAFVGPDGRCDESAFLEFHHVVPFAAGGPTTTENLELRCRAHNAYEAALQFGP
jgi:hypothetical protein